MNSRKFGLHWLRFGLAAAAIIGMGGAAQAATVTFSNIVDGDSSSLFFDTTTTVPTGDGDILSIGVNQFTADGNFMSSALDTLSMTITADPGRTITSITYTEVGFAETGQAVAFATGSIVADNQPINFPTVLFGPNAGGGWSITPESLAGSGKIFIDNKESISVSITNSLFAVALAPGEVARVTKEAAFLTVTTIPLPAAVWMFGAALCGLSLIGRRLRRTAVGTVASAA